MKVSIIIPVYNAQKFLRRCLDSILNQTLTDIEIICIDDCSKDDSFTILQEYAQKDERFQCFRNTKNIGQGLTRNRGLDVAKGEYVAFVDCDDWVEPTMYEALYSQVVVCKFDLIFCCLIYNLPDGSKLSALTEKIEAEPDFLIKEGIWPSIKYFSSNSPCDKLYRREYIEQLNLRFESERIFLYEDKFFNLSLLVSNPNCCFVPKALYHYMIRYGSTMTSYKQDFKDKYFVMDEKIKKLLSANNKIAEVFEQRFRNSLFEMTFSFCLNALIYNKSLRGKVRDFFSILNDKRISSNVKNFTLKDIPCSKSKINQLVKSVCFLLLKYIK